MSGLVVFKAPDSATNNFIQASTGQSVRFPVPVISKRAYDVHVVVMHQYRPHSGGLFPGFVLSLTHDLDRDAPGSSEEVVVDPLLWALFVQGPSQAVGTGVGFSLPGTIPLYLPRPYRIAGPQQITTRNDVGLTLRYMVQLYVEPVEVSTAEWLSLLHTRSRSSA